MATRTRTVVFTDMADYTAAVSRADREGVRKLLAEHAELVGPIVKRYDGRVVKNLGDSFMCLFDSATDAVRACLDMQDAVVNAGGISIKIGINTGDVEEIDRDAFGDAVNQASRILSKTPAGEIWFGPGTRVCMNASEIPWEEVGRFRLKGIPGEVETFRAVPALKCWLPDEITQAARRSKLVRIRKGTTVSSMLPPDAIVLLEGFTLGAPDLIEAISRLPVIEPAKIFMQVHTVSPVDRHQWLEGGRRLVVGTPAAVDRALFDAQKAISRQTGSDTIIMDGGSSDIELVLAGLALPVVPLADVVQSYSFDLLATGQWENQSERALVRVEVVHEGPRVHVASAGVIIDGRARAVQDVVPLRDGTTIDGGGRTHVYRALMSEGYFGVLLSDSNSRLGVYAGTPAEMGREPHPPGLKFPERKGQANIQWCVGQRAQKARAGGFTLDRALAGRRQASVVMNAGQQVLVTPLHDRCATFLYRSGTGRIERLIEAREAEIGDNVIVGTSVVGIRAPDAWS